MFNYANKIFIILINCIPTTNTPQPQPHKLPTQQAKPTVWLQCCCKQNYRKNNTPGYVYTYIQVHEEIQHTDELCDNDNKQACLYSEGSYVQMYCFLAWSGKTSEKQTPQNLFRFLFPKFISQWTNSSESFVIELNYRLTDSTIDWQTSPTA